MKGGLVVYPSFGQSFLNRDRFGYQEASREPSGWDVSCGRAPHSWFHGVSGGWHGEIPSLSFIQSMKKPHSQTWGVEHEKCGRLWLILPDYSEQTDGCIGVSWFIMVYLHPLTLTSFDYNCYIICYSLFVDLTIILYYCYIFAAFHIPSLPLLPSGHAWLSPQECANAAQQQIQEEASFFLAPTDPKSVISWFYL